MTVLAPRSIAAIVALPEEPRTAGLMRALGIEPGLALAIGRPSGNVRADVVLSDGEIFDQATPHVLLGADRPAADPGNVAALLPADAPAATVAAAMRLAAAGYRILAPAETGHPQLSARETEVLKLLAEGAPNKLIARRLDVSVHTAKFHVGAVLRKLGATNRTDAVTTAIREGLVSIA